MYEYEYFAHTATTGLTSYDRILIVPLLIQYGRRVVVYRMWNADKYPYQEIMKVFYIMCMTLAREPKTQVRRSLDFQQH